MTFSAIGEMRIRILGQNGFHTKKFGVGSVQTRQEREHERKIQDGLRRTAFGTGVLVSASVGLAIVLSPFWKSVYWAIVLAILFWPLRQRMVGWPSGRTAIVTQIESGVFRPAKILKALPTRFPKLAEFLPQVGLDLETIKSKVGQGFVSMAQFAVANIAVIGHGASAFALRLILALYILFSLLQHGDKVYRKFFDVFPASRHSKERYFAAFADMSVATIKGMVSVGIVQAILGGLIFWMLGIPSQSSGAR